MKKYINKGLIYSWFNSAKFPIIIGLIIWCFTTYINLFGRVFSIKNAIAYSFSNYASTEDLSIYLILGVIFIAIYFISQGVNKRNVVMFLSSGPYTKKQIKYNELMCILITLIPFVLAYIYIAIMIYIGNSELISIVDGYATMIIIEILRIVLIGTLLILFMLIIDSMFSNSVIGFICMISAIPLSIILILGKVYDIINYTGINISLNFVASIRRLTYHNYSDEYNLSILLNSITLKSLGIRQLLMEAFVVLILIIVGMCIFNITQKIYKIENSNKIFTSKINENIIVLLFSSAVGSIFSLKFLSSFIYNLQFRDGKDLPLIGLNLIKGLGCDMLLIGIISFISFKLIKKILKNLI